ncbi:hypothetical protein HGRIS_009915 [Hohenbuehelia grisea]|uniref:Kinesin motor domain-containing protein n=1 Tax=Hohenbuehelia grisea TaxID=104357 RepID=A0ABR3J2L6_9AGAR
MVAAGSITVAVRVRPPTSWEAARLPEPTYDSPMRCDGALSTPLRPAAANTAPLRDIVQVVDDRILTFDPDEKDRARAFVERGFLPPGTKRYKDRRFMFDKVFAHEARQTEVYDATAKPLLSGLLDGYNATVFAYGATGCGKTHTISGTDTDPGIIYLTMADLFQRIEDRSDEWNVETTVTFLEIYNEEIRDLLAEPGTTTPRGGLCIREDKAVKVVGLTELRPRTAEEVKEIVLAGNLRRTQSPTHANETSSRSHAVLQVHVMQTPRTAALTEQRTLATLSIIDLAGSERAAATMNMGQRMVEGANINKSLLALGNCINALCESGGAVRHVPYRNSKLTRLLKFSLGGNCKTVMIVCVAPTSNHFDDTHNTLIYAERATKIKTKVVTRNVVNVDRHVGRYVEAINRLNIEIAELKAKVAGRIDKEAEIQRRKKTEAAAEVDRVRSDMQAKVEHTRSSILDGATCSGKLSVANIRLTAIRARLAEIDARASSSALSADLEAERALLQSLAGPEEQVIKPDSDLSTRLRRSGNSNAMFEATLRAVSERRSDKLDEMSLNHVRLDAKFHKAEMDKIRAEGERDTMSEAVSDMAQVVVSLVGMLGRCTIMVGEAARLLNQPPDADAGATMLKVAGLLTTVKEKNDEEFKRLIGHSTEGYVMAESLQSFKGYETSFNRRISSGPAILQQAAGKPSRRSSAYGASTAPSSLSMSLGAPSPRRAHRKSLRSSLAGQPYRRVSDKEKKSKVAKNVQWRDEAGQGNIDDRSLMYGTATTVVISPAEEGDKTVNASTLASGSADSSRPPSRSMLLPGSESEWEDENEKTDDSLSLSFLNTSASSSRMYGSLNSKRSRPSRLDSGFLRSKSHGSILGSLAEDDESASSPERAHQPLGDRSLNRLGPDELSTLHVPKGRHGLHGSPGRRGPSSAPRSGTSLSSSVLGKSANGRRRSNVGPMRNDKGRRRSSLIPQLSPQGANSSGGEGKSGPSAARRVLISSPSKRSKRLSLAGAKTLSFKSKPSMTLAPSAMLGVPSLDPNASADISFSKLSKPTWR